MPCSTQLVDERRQCAAVLYRFNTVNAVPEVVQRMRERYFRAAIEAAWSQLGLSLVSETIWSAVGSVVMHTLLRRFTATTATSLLAKML